MRRTSRPFYIVHNGILENITESAANENFIKSYSQERPTIIFRREAPFYITHACADYLSYPIFLSDNNLNLNPHTAGLKIS